MPKKEPLQGGEPVRGGNTPSIVQDGYSGKIPMAAITDLEWEAAGIMHGTATLILHIRDSKLARFTTSRERSHMAEAPHE
ncbi:MAG: hypothetical protein LBB98_10760 [Treponema sp.]|nr:hypothetical protein [Treponema sp.]